MPSKKLNFQNAKGETLIARLDAPTEQTRAYALFAHCFTCSKDLSAVRNINRALNSAGIAVLRFDFTGLGESEGDFADTNFSSNVDDLIAAANYLEQEFAAPQLLIGHSLGGAAVLMAAASLPSVRAVATLCAPAEPEHVSHMLESHREEIEARGEATVSLAGRQFTIKKQFLDDLSKTHMQEVISNLRRALIVLHSPIDNTVGIDNAADIFIAAKHPKSFVTLDNADHLLTNPQDSRYAGQVIASWAARYLELEMDAPAPADSGSATWKQNAPQGYVSARTGTSYYTEIAASGHDMLMDEPEALGGTNKGPNPFDYMSAALAGCTSLTLRMYANRKKLPVNAIQTDVKYGKVTQNGANGEKKRVHHFDMQIAIDGDIDAATRERMLEISERCPIHKLLESEVLFDSALKDDVS